jgi:hypothetical protein
VTRIRIARTSRRFLPPNNWRSRDRRSALTEKIRADRHVREKGAKNALEKNSVTS